MVELTAAHWVYAFFIVLILLTMALKRETPIVCIAGSLILAWVITGNLVKAVQAVFNAITVAASELLGVVVIISMIVAMAKMLEETGLAEMMFRPVVGLMKTPAVAFWVMGFVIMIVAWVTWPSPAIVLVGALLLPAAVKVSCRPSVRPWPSACSVTGARSLRILSSKALRASPPKQQGSPSGMSWPKACPC